MAATFDPTDPRHLTPEQRLDELAAILATGVRRALTIRDATATPPPAAPPPNPAESPRIRLDVCAESRLHVPRG